MYGSDGDGVDVCEIYCDHDPCCACVVLESSQIATSHESHVNLSGNDEKRRKMNEIVHDDDDGVVWTISDVWRSDGGVACHNGQEMAIACLHTSSICS